MKLKKLVALITAGALCLGMSITAFAADKDDSREKVPAYATDENGKVLPLEYKETTEATVKEALKDPEKIADLFEQKGFDLKTGETPVVVFSKDVGLKDGEKIPEGGLDLDLNIGSAAAAGLEHGDTVYVFHWGKDGLEIIPVTVITVNGNAVVKVHVSDLSPFAVVKVMSNGKVVKVDTTTGKRTNLDGTNTPSSPKTGE